MSADEKLRRFVKALDLDLDRAVDREKLARLLGLMMEERRRQSLGRSDDLESDPPRISDRFLKRLPTIAWKLSMARIWELEEYHFLKPEQLREYDGVELHINGGISPNEMIELAEILRLISQGADARKLFRQDGRPKPKSRDHFGRALVYWSWRAIDPSGSDKAAALAAAAPWKGGKVASRAWIRKIAQKHRKRCLEILENPKGRVSRLKDLREQVGLGGELEAMDLKPLREYLRKKSARILDDMERFLGGKTPRVH